MGRCDMMYVDQIAPLRIRRGIFHSFRFQLLLVIVCGVVLPTLAALAFAPVGILSDALTVNSIYGSAIAATLSVYVLRRLGLYPSTPVVRYILPTIAIMYAAVFTAIAILRLEHSNTILALSFIGTVAARYAIATINIRGPQLTYYLVPGGKSGIVQTLPNLVFVSLAQPDLPAIHNAVFIADLHYDHPPEWERLLAEAALSGRPVYHYKQVWEAGTGQVQIEHLSENSFGSLIPSLTYGKIKRAADLFLCLLLLPLLAPIMAVAALAIKFDSPGPVCFRQARMGFRGNIFKVCKFRTMSITHDGEHRDSSQTQAGDDRITRVGRFLRKTRIDELPQIWNILRGEMSWIGPRPEAISLSEWYEQELPFYRYRHIVRPGISGWAQVNQGHVTALGDVDHKLQFDFYYIKNISYWLDILIFFKTLRVVLTGFGAK